MTEPTFRAPPELFSVLEKNPTGNIRLPRQHMDDAPYPLDVFYRLVALDMLYVFRSAS